MKGETIKYGTIQFNLTREDVDFLKNTLKEFLFDWACENLMRENGFIDIPREIFVAKRLYDLVKD